MPDSGLSRKTAMGSGERYKKRCGFVSSAASLDLTLHQLLHKSPSAPTLSPLAPPSPLPSSSHAPLQTALSSLDASLSSGSGTPFEKNSARIVRAHALFALGEWENCLEGLHGVELECPVDGAWEGYDLVLRVVGSAVEGHSLTHLDRPLEASTAYTRAARVYDEACDILQNSGSKSGADVELHRVGEDVLFRLCAWGRENSPPSTSYPHHKLYIYLSSRTSLPSSLTPYTPSHLLAIHTSFRRLLYATHSWSDLSLSNRAQEAILQKETKLPAAGESNERYLVFLDQVEEGWRRSGAGREGAKEVVDIMYRALTHTFATHRLLRHLSRALVALGSHSEAAKSLSLYLDLFSKSKETDPRKVARELRRFRAAEAGEEQVDEKVELDGEKEGEHEEGESDFDSDEQFVRTAVWATRVFVRNLGEPQRGLEFARKAREVFDASGEGIKNANPSTRPTSHSQALTHLQKAHVLNPTSWPTLYHLSYQLAELRQLEPALEKARMAVSLPGGKKSREAWHLLGLLAGAKGKDWGNGLLVLETALDDEVEEEEEVEDSLKPKVAAPTTNGDSIDLNGIDARLSHLDDPVSTISGLPAFEYFRDETEQLEAEVQLRITKNVVIEVMEGPEAALLDQQSLLAYFSAAFANIKDVPETTKTAPPTLNIPTISEPAASTKKAHSILSRPRSIRHSIASHTPGLRTPTNPSSNLSAGTPAGSRRSLAIEPNNPSVISLDESPSTPSSGDATATRLSGVNAVPSVETNARATKLLVDLWLLSAASYRRAGRLEDAKGAIAEAEALDADDPDVWVQLALYHTAQSDLSIARTCLAKSLSFVPDHSPALVLLSRLYLTEATTTPSGLTKKLPFAEGILETLTKRQGWDSPEAWFELSRCFKLAPGVEGRRKERERECLVWALQLEETRAVREWKVVPRVL
ncbi:hypothetical protein BCR35DRAFT_334838 [Leucosporidium creatinivorum]|uniref:Uncharacterized protein n=1 Tax=Leucosporidium creatinivorum TaxID=106004 RepID=A0A1Y2DW71_9BASI|nr:hypothetical protein BCR35DRAFT_334838 [Leucosporidium creatinivorum]